MDDLLQEFLTETGASLELVDLHLVRIGREPDNADLVAHAFRLVHTVKGTCGFLGLERLEALAHAAETLLGGFRDGGEVTADAVGLALAAIDRSRSLLADIATDGDEPPGDDTDILALVDAFADPVPAPPRAAEPAAPVRAARSPAWTAAAALDDRQQILHATAAESLAGPEHVRAIDFARVAAELDAQLARTQAIRPSAAEPVAAEGTRSVRVPLDALDALALLADDLAATRDRLLDIDGRHGDAAYRAPLQRLAALATELQQAVARVRVQPIAAAFQSLPRLARDLALDLGKDVALETAGGDIELDRGLLDLIRDPLVHLVRNAVDHGLEAPEQRRAAGKPATGAIRVAAWCEAGDLVVEVADDGRGIDAAAIRAKALDARLAGPGEIEAMAAPELLRFAFHPGVSTAPLVTRVSGRGVGLDIVRTNAEAAGGSVDVTSVPGQGTRFLIRVPLSGGPGPTARVTDAGLAA